MGAGLNRARCPVARIDPLPTHSLLAAGVGR